MHIKTRFQKIAGEPSLSRTSRHLRTLLANDISSGMGSKRRTFSHFLLVIHDVFRAHTDANPLIVLFASRVLRWLISCEVVGWAAAGCTAHNLTYFGSAAGAEEACIVLYLFAINQNVGKDNKHSKNPQSHDDEWLDDACRRIIENDGDAYKEKYHPERQ